MKKLIILFVFGLFLGNISALCEEGQIEINSASLEELDDLYGIGPVKAQAIIDTRPFDSVDDLIKVYGIGPSTLQKIKDQGLACVEEETEKEIIEEQEENNEEEKEIEEDKTPEQENEVKEKTEQKEIKLEIIKLEPKDIKTENNKEVSDKNNYAMYGFVIFCVLIGFLFIFKKNKFNKNEFR